MATGNDFMLVFKKDNNAFPVVLTDEQQEVFNICMGLIPGQITVGNKSMGKLITLKELKEMGEI